MRAVPPGELHDLGAKAFPGGVTEPVGPKSPVVTGDDAGPPGTVGKRPGRGRVEGAGQ